MGQGRVMLGTVLGEYGVGSSQGRKIMKRNAKKGRAKNNTVTKKDSGKRIKRKIIG